MELHDSVESTLRRLQEAAAGVPVLALGQTVFWDEPLKAALPILAEEVGADLGLIAGVHDTDYFAKLPGGVHSREPFVALAKNDGSTKEFWSAAGEFSALFGSETPVTREVLAEAGVSLERILRGDHGAMDSATEAWGWRGVAGNYETPRVTAEIPMVEAFETLQATFIWALNETLATLSEPEQKAAAEDVINALRTMTCDAREMCPNKTLSAYYECLLPQFHQIVTGLPSKASFTRTTNLLTFNRSTASLPRFRFVDLFLCPKTADLARTVYDDSVRGTEVYTLDRFGTGAIPFDLVIPGQGRGTVRLTSQMLVVMTPEPKFVKLPKPIESAEELAAVVEDAFGPCTLVGKAITFISMLAAEFVFAFHEGASMYVSQTREIHNALRKAGVGVQAHPILRIGHEAWDALCSTSLWFRLPEPLRSPFGAEVVSGPTIGKAWRCVVEQQRTALTMVGEARNIAALIRALHKVKGGRWETLAGEYESLRESLAPLDDEVHRVRGVVQETHERLRSIKREWVQAEVGRGKAFRAGDEEHRAALGDKISALRVESHELREFLERLREQQAVAPAVPAMQAARSRRKEIEREAELARLRLVQEAVMATAGLEKTNRRPAAWWFPVVSPDGDWFRDLLPRIQLRLEPLVDA
ncbi:MAG: hypothetical protein ACR2HJ_13355 [Fimbriimonadales bacterium]